MKIMIQMKKHDLPLTNVKRKIPWELLVFIILIVNALYWCARKEGFYIDELWSYGLSNSYYCPSLNQKENYMNRWHQPSFYEDYLTVRRGEAFSYGSVYDNQVHDVHPPCYYILLHTVCSLFPDHFSKWFGLTINLLFFCGSIYLLYQISGIILGEKRITRVIPPLLYGLSMGAVSTLIYIRMYMLLTFLALLFVFLTFLLIGTKDNKKGILLLIGIGLTMSAGFLTQYYFLIFAFFFVSGYVIWNMIARQQRRVAEYLAAVSAGTAGGVLIFPASIHHILEGQQGKRAFSNAYHNIPIFFNRWKQYWDTIMREFWGNGHRKQEIILLVFFILIIAAIYSAKKKKLKLSIWNTVPKIESLILSFTVLGYFSLIVQISPEITDRYQFIIYPFCVLLGVSITTYLFRLLGKEWFIWIAAACCLFLMFETYRTQPVPYVYEGYQEMIDKLGTDCKNVPGIYVTTGDHLLINNCFFLAKQNMTYPLTFEQLSEIPELCKGTCEGQLVLYVDIYYNEQQTAEQVAKLLEYRSYSLLYDNTFTQIFLLSQ